MWDLAVGVDWCGWVYVGVVWVGGYIFIYTYVFVVYECFIKGSIHMTDWSGNAGWKRASGSFVLGSNQVRVDNYRIRYR